jgi:hypothetical protein
MALDPANGKIKEFIIKILLDGATQSQLNHNYQNAFNYLEKAKSIDPTNRKVLEMYQLTKDVLSSSSDSNTPVKEVKKPSKKPAVETTETKEAKVTKKSEPQARKQEPQPQPQVQKVIYKEVEVRQTQPVQSYERRAGEYSGNEANNKLLYFILFVCIVWAIAGTVLFVMYLVYYQQEKIKREQARDMLNEMEENSQKISDEKTEIYKGLEKSRELLDYEHRTVEQLRNELSEVRKKEYDKMRAELDLRTKQIEQRLRLEMGATERPAGNVNFKEAIFHQEKEQFKKDIDSSPDVAADEVTSPSINALRERISMMALNLYENAPQAAVDFLMKFANDANPLIRMNVISALMRISSNETTEILIRLYQDPDNRVKREALKNLAELDKKIKNKELVLNAETAAKIKTILSNEKANGEWVF